MEVQWNWMKVVLTRKLAERIDGIDLEGFNVGDVVPASEAEVLIAEGWATLERRALRRPVGHERRREERSTAAAAD